MEPLQNLFKFPILMVDGNVEEKKTLLGLTNDEELDLIQGWAECAVQDFVSITDRWIPTPESFENAKNGKFDATFVVFANAGSFIVPWTREKFKNKMVDFINALPVEEEVIEVGPEEMIKIIELQKNRQNGE